MPTRRLSDVIHGLQSLFSELIDFEDPLNVQAAKQYASSPDAFQKQVKTYIRDYARA